LRQLLAHQLPGLRVHQPHVLVVPLHRQRMPARRWELSCFRRVPCGPLSLSPTVSARTDAAQCQTNVAAACCCIAPRNSPDATRKCHARALSHRVRERSPAGEWTSLGSGARAIPRGSPRRSPGSSPLLLLPEPEPRAGGAPGSPTREGTSAPLMPAELDPSARWRHGPRWITIRNRMGRLVLVHCTALSKWSSAATSTGCTVVLLPVRSRDSRPSTIPTKRRHSDGRETPLASAARGPEDPWPDWAPPFGPQRHIVGGCRRPALQPGGLLSGRQRNVVRGATSPSLTIARRRMWSCSSRGERWICRGNRAPTGRRKTIHLCNEVVFASSVMVSGRCAGDSRNPSQPHRRRQRRRQEYAMPRAAKRVAYRQLEAVTA
jgi:hypothetical protein